MMQLDALGQTEQIKIRLLQVLGYNAKRDSINLPPSSNRLLFSLVGAGQRTFSVGNFTIRRLLPALSS